MTMKDDAWLEDLLRESSQDSYLPDDGFSVQVMQSVAASEEARFLKIRRMLFAGFAIVTVMLIAKFFTLSNVADITQYLFSDVAITTLIPAALLVSFMTAGGVLNFLKD